MSLTPEEQNQFEEFKKTPEMKYLNLVIREAINQSLDSFVKKVGDANKELSLYTIGDVCEIFHVTPATIHNWKKNGLLIGKRVGKNRYFSRDEVNEAIRYWQNKRGY